MFDILTKPQYGNGNVVEAMKVGTKENSSINVRELPLEALYPSDGPTGQDNHVLEEEQKLAKHLQANGMRK